MRTLIAFAATAVTALTLAGVAGATTPQHFRSSEHVTFVDDTCGFPIAADLVVANDVTEFDDADGSIASLQLHQAFVGTWTANGVTLTENDRYTIFVDFSAGSATEAKHVGLSFRLTAPDGRLFQIAGQQVFAVVGGFDRDLLLAHGIFVDFDLGAYCAAFA